MKLRIARRPLMQGNERLDADEFFGYALVSYLYDPNERAGEGEYDSWQAAARVMAAFKIRGIRYRENCLSADLLSESSYTDTVLPLLKNCSHYVSIYSDKLLLPKPEDREGDAEASVLRNHFWYQVGYLSSYNTSHALAKKKEGREEGFFISLSFRERTLPLRETPMEDENIRRLVEETDKAAPEETDKAAAPESRSRTPLGFAADLAAEDPLLLYPDFYGGRRLIDETRREDGQTKDAIAARLYLLFTERLNRETRKPKEPLSAYVERTLDEIIKAELSEDDFEKYEREMAAVSHIHYHRIALSLSLSRFGYWRMRRSLALENSGQERLGGGVGEHILCGAQLFAFGKTDQESAKEIPLARGAHP